MQTSLLKVISKHHLWMLIAILMSMGTVTSHAQVIELAVGEGYYLYTPTPEYPYTAIMHASWDTSEAPNMGFSSIPDNYSAHAGIRNAFSGTQKISCTFVWYRISDRGGRVASPPMTKTWYFKCKGGGNNSGSGTVTSGELHIVPETLELEEGEERVMSCWATGLSGSVADTWSSSNSSVATVERTDFYTAKVKAKSAGQCTISVTSGGLTATCSLTVKEKKIPIFPETGGPRMYCHTANTNLVTYDDGATMQITGNTSKSYGKGGANIVVDGATYASIKNSNGAQNTFTAPDGNKIYRVNFYVVPNADGDAPKFTEFAGATVSQDITTVKNGANPTKIVMCINGASSVTFTFSEKQVNFIMEVDYSETSYDAQYDSIVGTTTPEAGGTRMYCHTANTNLVTYDDGATMQITGNTSKSYGKGGANIAVDGTTYASIKNFNGAQNTFTAADGNKIYCVNFYAVPNVDGDAPKLTEFAGATVSQDITTVKNGANPTKIVMCINGASSVTFTFNEKQVNFIMEVDYSETSYDAQYDPTGNNTGEPTTKYNITLPVMQTVAVGETIQLTPIIEPASTEATLTWSTDDASIAKVTSKGVVMGIKEGTAIITVMTDNGLKAECFVMVQLASGISSVGVDSEDAPVYTLSGQRLAAPRKGLNIRGGKKIVVK